MKRYLFILIGLFILPGIVYAANDVDITITCNKDEIGVGETSHCEVKGNTSKIVNYINFDIYTTTNNLQISNIEGLYGFEVDYEEDDDAEDNFVGAVALSSADDQTGEFIFASFDVEATGDKDLDGQIILSGIRVSGEDMLSASVPVKGISVLHDEYTYTYKCNDDTSICDYKLYKNGVLYSDNTQVTIYANEDRTQMLATSTTSSFSMLYENVNNDILYGKRTVNGQVVLFEIKPNKARLPKFVIDSHNGKVTLKLLNEMDGVTYQYYRDNSLLSSNVDNNPVPGKLHKYMIKATKDNYSITYEVDYLCREVPVFRIYEQDEGVNVIEVTPANEVYVYNYYMVDEDGNQSGEAFTENKKYVEVEMDKLYEFWLDVEFNDDTTSGISNIVEFTNTALNMDNPTNVKATIYREATKAPYVKLTYDAVENASGYIIKQGNTVLADTKELSYTLNNAKYGVSYTFFVQAYRCKNEECTEKVETDEIASNAVSTNIIKPALTVATQTRYDQFKLTIAKPSYGMNSNNKLTYKIYRAKQGGSYSLVKTITNAPLNAAYNYVDTISGATINATYYYKVEVLVDSAKVTTDVKSAKSTVKTPTVTLVNNTNSSQYLTVANLGPNVKYEYYRATTKKGKYKKICDSASTACSSTKLGWNRTLFYKVRAYYTLNGKKTYTSYSTIVSRKLTMIQLDKYPVTYKVNGTQDIIKSVTVTRKSTAANSKYQLSIKHTKTVSSKKQTVKYKIRFYNYNKKQYKDVWVSVTLAKGTKKNPTTKSTIYVPNWATQMDFM